MTEAEQRLEQLRKHHARSSTKDTIVQLCGLTEGEPADYAIVDGVVYRRAEHQEETLSLLKEQDLRREFIDRFGPEAFDLLFEIETLSNDRDMARIDRIEEKLCALLPRHAKTIHSVIDSDDPEFILTLDDLSEQAPCLKLI